ncbi:hypothetical protein [Photobacterium nomapromontoriensis]|uniref:hypothetical protein n=1 Tax=Photobacterium nomapromontoriensis TaxID=2910237 RepID=UPI003D13723D
MSSHQGIIEFLAMSGILHVAAMLLVLMVFMVIVVVAVVMLSKKKKANVSDDIRAANNQKFMTSASYYDPTLPERMCENCAGTIKRGKVMCEKCGALSPKGTV